jgi:putative endonuclease
VTDRKAASSRKAAGTKAAGDRGEALAARHLEALGYRIVERNYRCAHGEIDLIASQGEYLVFVEVKTRRGRTEYHPVLAVNARKMEKLRTLGSFYLAEHPETNLQPRFDVIAVVLRAPHPLVEHFENAF